MNTVSNWIKLVLSSCLLLPALANAEDWSYEIEPYALFANIEGDASIGRATGADVDVDFDTILENLDAAGMLHFEAHHKDGWGVVFDYGFMDLGDDISGPRGGVVDASLRQGVFEALALRRYQLADGLLDYTVGLRWWDNDIDVTVDPARLPGTLDVEVEEDWVDLVVGVRWLNDINQNWKLLLQGDVGGFGLESDFTSSVQVGALYQLSDACINLRGR